ncbi:hypothetical protein [Leminorella grimontii]|uniref:hypothetical protein n=1 Tax=Leminorella grimontii TaxID=82981 RepID=UPI00321FF16E
MRKPSLKAIPLDMACYKAGLLASLLSAMMEKFADECSPKFHDLITIAADLNQEITTSLRAEVGE